MEFVANTFDEMAEQSRQHGMEMMKRQDTAHLEAMEKMRSMMTDPKAMKAWIDARKKDFDNAPDL